jgi:hypothetical protein
VRPPSLKSRDFLSDPARHAVPHTRSQKPGPPLPRRTLPTVMTPASPRSEKRHICQFRMAELARELPGASNDRRKATPWTFGSYARVPHRLLHRRGAVDGGTRSHAVVVNRLTTGTARTHPRGARGAVSQIGDAKPSRLIPTPRDSRTSLQTCILDAPQSTDRAARQRARSRASMPFAPVGGRRTGWRPRTYRFAVRASVSLRDRESSWA